MMEENFDMAAAATLFDFRGKRVFLFQPKDIANTNFTPVPYGLACIGAMLQKMGAEVDAFDQNAPYVDSSPEHLMGLIRRHRPHYIGMRLSITATVTAYDAIKRIKKEFKDVPVIVGGPHATINSEEVLRAGADFIVRKEGEVTILHLLNALTGGEDLAKVRGMAYIDDAGKVIITAERPPIQNLSVLPLPAKALFRKEDYIRTSKDLKNFACIFTSRDCPGKCTYCAAPVLGERYRYRGAENVLDEVQHLHEYYGITYFYFMDDAFTVEKSRVTELCGRLKDELGFKISFMCNSVINHTDRETLKTLKDAGCTDIIYGVERIDKESQKRIRKGYRTEKVEEVINDSIELGINSCVNFMFGFPWDRKELIDENFTFIKKYYPKVFFNMSGVVVPYPGTELYGQFRDTYRFDDWWLRDPMRLADENRPFFRKKVFCDDSIIDRNFFRYGSDIKRYIRRVYWWIIWNNARCSFRDRGLSGWLQALMRITLYRLSQLLFYINPAIERKVFRHIEKITG